MCLPFCNLGCKNACVAELRRHSEIGPVGQRVGENLRALRDAQGMKTAGLAAAVTELGVPMTASTVTKIEIQSRRVNVDELVALALALDVSPVTLLLPRQAPDTDPSDPQSERVGITDRVSVPWETAWRWMHGEWPYSHGEWPSVAKPEHIRRFRAVNRPYEGEPISEAGRMLGERLRAATWEVSIRGDETGYTFSTGKLQSRTDSGGGS